MSSRAARCVAVALLALVLAVGLGGAAGWGLHYASASTHTASAPTPSASPAPTPSATPTPAASASGAAPPRKRVALIGDSLTYGSGLAAPQDLPSVLRKLRPDLDVISVAVGGQQSADLVGRVRQFRLLHADEAVVWIGGQDADDRVNVESFRGNLDKLVTALAPARVVLVTPIADYAVGGTLFLPFAAATRDLAHQRGVPLVDLDNIPRSSYLSDNTHLDAATERRIAVLYAKAL